MKYTWKQWKFLLRERWPVYLGYFLILPGMSLAVISLFIFAAGYDSLGRIMISLSIAFALIVVVVRVFRETELDIPKYVAPLLWIQIGRPPEDYPADEVEKQWVRADLIKCMESCALAFALKGLQQKICETAMKEVREELAKFETSRNPMCPREFYEARQARQEKLLLIKLMLHSQHKLDKVVGERKTEFHQHWELIIALGLKPPVDDKGKYLELIEQTEDYKRQGVEVKNIVLDEIEDLRRRADAA